MPTTGPVVAVLDDEPEMRKALRRLLTSRGFRVEEYERGEDLLAALGSHPLDYLLLDLHMPGTQRLRRAGDLPLPADPRAGHRHHRA